jgi:beta-lactamase superfamily II metal-dependent hydrolase
MNCWTICFNSLKPMTRPESEHESSPIVKIAFFDVGQADTMVISLPETHEAIVVDCVDANAVLDYLAQEQIRFLRGIIITHLHADHYREVTSLIANYHQVPGMQECDVAVFNKPFNKKLLATLTRDADGHSTTYELTPEGASRSRISAYSDLIDWHRRNKLRFASLKVEHRPLPFKGRIATTIHLIHPYAADFEVLEAKGLNDTSIVLRVNGAGTSALLTGDLEPFGWRQLADNHQGLSSDLLKFPHHGGAWNCPDTDALLSRTEPSVVVISVGTGDLEGNKYGHPSEDVFAMLSRRRVQLLCTQATNQCGNSALNKRSAIVAQYKAHGAQNGYEPIISRSGCLCAGTIVVELGDKVRILQPELEFHRKVIVVPHFQNHKCVI